MMKFPPFFLTFLPEYSKISPNLGKFCPLSLTMIFWKFLMKTEILNKNFWEKNVMHQGNNEILWQNKYTPLQFCDRINIHPWLPGSFSGRDSSPRPHLGPEPRNLISLAIFMMEQATTLQAPDTSTMASWLARASNLLGAVTKGRPVRSDTLAAT